jgi:Zn finger protein HypA/HybF involved in hydrogenase expression
MADEINPGFVACDDCNRVLAVDDGPTCPECKSEARKAARQAARESKDKDD